ncbi:Transposase IS66 [Crocosphaera chwakensis CCY0110]|uniref:Transposase IS66 n=1 Tax=Crocosphaera chwakensis CCY0110 TaxID=391612 RepID=A3IWE7_9CHRO|nr:Transposase IS66 [Crocosphaera chwakensis CCY0110]
MSQTEPGVQLNPDELNQLSKSGLVQIILAQQKLIEQLQKEIEKLKLSRNLDSQTSSKPPSTDLLKKSEKAKTTEDDKDKKRKPGGQPGHKGKTRKGFGRIDRIQILHHQYVVTVVKQNY